MKLEERKGEKEKEEREGEKETEKKKEEEEQEEKKEGEGEKEEEDDWGCVGVGDGDWEQSLGEFTASGSAETFPGFHQKTRGFLKMMELDSVTNTTPKAKTSWDKVIL